MKIKILAIVLLVLFSFGLEQVIAEQPGGGTPPAGNCPCYSVGQVVSQGGWYQSGYYYYVVETYIGNCQVRVDWYRNNVWFQSYTQAGGCTCACGTPIEDPPPID